jgi:hypothetical protein
MDRAFGVMPPASLLLLATLVWLTACQHMDPLATGLWQAEQQQQQQQQIQTAYGHDDIDYATIHERERMHQLSVSVTNASRNFSVIHCRNYKDFYTLLYAICARSRLCAELYYMDEPPLNRTLSTKEAAYIKRASFKKFTYQLALTKLFIVRDFNSKTVQPPPPTTTTPSENAREEQTLEREAHLLLLQDGWPLEWLPRYVIELNASSNASAARCTQNVNLSSAEGANFARDSILLMQLYKTFVINEYHCTDFNEHLVLDAEQRPHCLCRPNRSCNEESTYKPLIIALTIVLVLMAVALFFSNFYGTRSIKLN